ncbi:cation:proton antiporter [soil metagenome]
MNVDGSGVLAWSTDAAMIMLSIALLICIIRVAIGPTLPDRVIAIDLLAIVAIGMIGIYAVKTGEWALLDAATVLALVAFLGTVTFARYMERISADD